MKKEKKEEKKRTYDRDKRTDGGKKIKNKIRNEEKKMLKIRLGCGAGFNVFYYFTNGS